MADENKTVITTYKARLDQASYNSLSQKLKQQSDTQVKATQTANNLSKETRDELRLQVREQKKSNKERRDAIKQEKTRLQILEDQNTALRRQVGSVGDVDTALSAIRGGTGAIAGTDIVGLEQAAAVFELSEALVQLKAAAPAAIESMKSLVSSIGGKGIGLIAATGALTLALAAASAEAQRRAELARVVIDSQKEYFEIIQTGTTESIQIGRESAQITLDAARQELETRKSQREQINQDIGAMTGFFQGVVQAGISAGVTGGEVKELDNEIKALEKTILENELAVKNYDDALQSAQVAQNNATQGLLQQANDSADRQRFINKITKQSLEQNEALSQSLLEENDIIASQINLLQKSGDTSDEAKQAIEGWIAQLQANDAQLRELRNVGIPYTRQLAMEAEQKEKLEQQAKEQERDREQIAKQRGASLARLTGLEQSAIKALDEFARKQSEIVQDRAIRDQRELEDFNAKAQQANREHQQDLLDIQRDGNSRIADIQSDLDSLNSDFFKDDIEATQDYRRDLKKLNKQYFREDKQLLDDSLDKKLDAEQGNDVVAFIRAQNEFEKSQRQKESERSEEFAELNAQFREERRLRRDQLNDRRADLQRELQLERQQTQERLAQARRDFQEERQLENEQRQRDLQRQQQDDQIADQRARQALQRELQGINQKAQAELNAIRQVTSAVGQLEAIARRIAQAANSRSSSSSLSSSTRTRLSGFSSLKSYEIARRFAGRERSISTRAQGSARIATAFRDGGIVRGRNPQLAILGDGNSDEAIIPFNRSQGIRPALHDLGLMRPFGSGRRGNQSSTVLQFSPNVTVGDIATGNEVTIALQEFANDFQRQIETGFSKAVNQA